MLLLLWIWVLAVVGVGCCGSGCWLSLQQQVSTRLCVYLCQVRVKVKQVPYCRLPLPDDLHHSTPCMRYRVPQVMKPFHHS